MSEFNKLTSALEGVVNSFRRLNVLAAEWQDSVRAFVDSVQTITVWRGRLGGRKARIVVRP